MNWPRRWSAAVLNFVVLLALFLGSCVGPATMYVKSPWWFLEAVNEWVMSVSDLRQQAEISACAT